MDAPGSRAAADRQRLLQQGEAGLEDGDAEAALQAFDRAASMVHAADIEMGLVRSYMQAGQYRRAIDFAAHAAGAHRDVPAGTALYAWLLQAGGQQAVARRMLDEALLLAPDDAALRLARSEFDRPWPRASGILLEPPQRIAPYGHPAGLAAHGRIAGTAVLAASGTQAVAAGALVAGADAVWLRNGLGQTVAATVERRDADSGLVLLRLQAPLPVPEGLAPVPREPYAGSPGHLVEYADGAGTGAAWPLLRSGFFGRPLAAPGSRSLGIEAPHGPRGGPVFDGYGRLAGIAVAGVGGPDQMLSVGAVGERLGGLVAAAPPASQLPAQRASVDAVYEASLRLALQLIVRP
jgi:hypothetical protein